MMTLREMEPFSGLGRAAWAVLRVLSDHWQLRGECWPSMARIGAQAGYEERQVRSAVRELERLGVVVTWRERRRGVLHYAPGFTFARGVELYDERYPRGDYDALPETGNSCQRRPATIAAEPRAHTKGTSSSATPTHDEPPIAIEPTSPEEEQVVKEPKSGGGDVTAAAVEIGDDDRAAAVAALGARHERKYRGRQPAPRRWEPRDVARAARCAAALGGSREEKITAMLLAVEGAFAKSVADHHGAPSVTYVFGDLSDADDRWYDRFLDHVERARKRRASEARWGAPAKSRKTAEPLDVTPDAGDVVDARTAAADVERLFGASGGRG